MHRIICLNGRTIHDLVRNDISRTEATMRYVSGDLMQLRDTTVKRLGLDRLNHCHVGMDLRDTIAQSPSVECGRQRRTDRDGVLNCGEA
jgi:hypothetical protein